jgi:ferredoxin
MLVQIHQGDDWPLQWSAPPREPTNEGTPVRTGDARDRNPSPEVSLTTCRAGGEANCLGCLGCLDAAPESAWWRTQLAVPPLVSSLRGLL